MAITERSRRSRWLCCFAAHPTPGALAQSDRQEAPSLCRTRQQRRPTGTVHGPVPPQRPDRRLAAGRMAVAEIRERVAHGCWTPRLCAGLGPIPDDLAEAWLATGQLNDAEYQQLSVRHWRAQQPLPRAHRRWAESCGTLTALLEKMALPQGDDRQAYATRMVAALAVHQQRVEQRSAPQIAHAATGAISENCYACLEAFTEADPPVHLVDCQHTAALHRGCWRDALTKGDGRRCPSVGCSTPVPPEWAAEVGVPPRQVLALARRWAHALQASQPRFRPCPVAGCVGGTEVPLGNVARLTCGPCGTTSLLGPGVQMSLELLQRMLDGFLNNSAADVLPCYYCGIPTVKDGGCDAVTCQVSTCRRLWDFRPDFVPHAGAMVSLGLFEPLAPGARHVPHQQLVEALQTNLDQLNTEETIQPCR